MNPNTPHEDAVEVKLYAVVGGGLEPVNRAIAAMFIRHGYHIMLLGHDVAALEQVRNELSHENVSIFSCDSSDHESVKQSRFRIGAVTQHIQALVIDGPEMAALFDNLLEPGAWVINLHSDSVILKQEDVNVCNVSGENNPERVVEEIERKIFS